MLLKSLCGVVSEWLKEHAWKACNGQKPFKSSNLFNSAILFFISFSVIAAPPPLERSFITDFAVKECLSFRPDLWSQYGFAVCDSAIPYMSDKKTAEEIKFYSLWVQYTTEFKEKNKDIPSQTQANVLLWYLNRQKRMAELREEYQLIELFAAAKDMAKHISEIAQYLSPERKIALIKKIKKYNDERWIEKGWHRYLYQTKHWKNPIYPYAGEIEDYLKSSEGYMTGIESIIKSLDDKDSLNEWAKIRKNILSWNKYVKQKILPKARKNVSISLEWYQLLLTKYGVSIGAEELISRAEEDYKKTLKEFRSLAEKIAKEEKYPSSNPRDVIKEFEKTGVEEWPEVEKRYREAESFIANSINKNEIVTLPAEPIKIRRSTPTESLLIPAPTVLVGPDPTEPPVYVVPVMGGGRGNPTQTHMPLITALLAHEGRPGHDLQMRILLGAKLGLATGFYTHEAAAYNEGWALYAEELVYPYFDDKTKLYSLAYRLLRMARAYIDPKLHLGEMKPEEAERILTEEIGLPPIHVQAELRRYLHLFPGQASSYYAGLIELKGMRARFEKEWGKKFKQRCFHDALLKLGGAPWADLEEALRKQKPCG